MIVKFTVVIAVAFLSSVVYLTPIDDKKPFACPPNENYYKCHLEVCYKTCEDLSYIKPCPQIDAKCYLPSCECVDGYLRQEPGGVCIPRDKCPKSAHLNLDAY